MRNLRKRVLAGVLSVIGLLSVGTQSALAQSGGGGGGGGALGDIIIDAIKGLLRILFSPIRTVIQNYGDTVLRTVVGTPHPDEVFVQPTNSAWPAIYDFYWQTMMPLTLSLYGLSIGMVIFLESTSHLFNGYHRSKLKKRAFSGLLGILSWWWIAALSLRFMDALAGFLVPSVSDISLFQTLSFSTMGVLGIVVALSTNFVLFVLIGIIYLARHLALYLFVFLMPLLIVFWIPGVGPFALVSKFMKKLAGFYVPFLFMTVPVALLFRLGDLLGTSAGLSAGEFGAWLTALVIPLVAVVSPFILFWQAGALFFLADRASRHMSAQKARNRLAKGRDRAHTTKQGGKNFVRGLRDEPAVTRNGQYVFSSGDSRAHAAGQRMSGAGSGLRDMFRNGTSGTKNPTSNTTPALPSGSPSALPDTNPPALPPGGSDGSGGDNGGGDGSSPTGYDRSTHDNLRDPSHRSSTATSRDQNASHTDSSRTGDSTNTGGSSP